MHDDIAPGEDVIRQLLSEKTPQWADLPIRRLASSGTDNAIYRIGEGLLLRLPRREDAVRLIDKELDWLPRFAGLHKRTEQSLLVEFADANPAVLDPQADHQVPVNGSGLYS